MVFWSFLFLRRLVASFSHLEHLHVWVVLFSSLVLANPQLFLVWIFGFLAACGPTARTPFFALPGAGLQIVCDRLSVLWPSKDVSENQSTLGGLKINIEALRYPAVNNHSKRVLRV